MASRPWLSRRVVTQIAGGLQQEVAVHHPQAAINRRSDLERELSFFHFACLLNVPSAGHQKLPVRAGKLKGDASVKRFPVLPEFARFRQQLIGLGKAVEELFHRLAFLGKAEEGAERLSFRYDRSMHAIANHALVGRGRPIALSHSMKGGACSLSRRTAAPAGIVCSFSSCLVLKITTGTAPTL